MQTINLRHQLYLRGRKIALASLLIFGLGYNSYAQNNPSDNLINYEDQWIHYGFLIGVHSSKYVIKHSDYFTSPAMDTVHSIVPGNLGGFKLGFVINMKLGTYTDFRILPTVGFYENDLSYRFTNGTTQRELKDATMVELPMLIKYKSARRGNLAMYMLAGINPSLEASGKGDEQDVGQKLELRNWDVSIDVGVGLDMYFAYFKFSPEIRYSYGMRNMLSDNQNDFSIGLDRLTRQNLGIFITFEGGPSGKRKLGGKTKGAGQIKARQKKRLKQ
ncbi:outer membrane beta-barrel protein [Ekhidna sp.]|uniref:type IX secretion/gliding motility protein PorT/SprT n=1 Tax=Ekhidna sp. TaxID=2608089 RepID=UPI003CCC34BF